MLNGWLNEILQRAGPIKWHWSSQDSIKYIKQSWVTYVNQDGCQSTMTLWFRRETIYIMLDTSGKETHLRYLYMWSKQSCLQTRTIDRLLGKFPTCHQGFQDTYEETQKGRIHHFQGITEADHCWHSWGPHTKMLFHSMLIFLGVSHQRPCSDGLRTSSALLPTWLWRFFLAKWRRLPCSPCCLPDHRLRL